MQLIYINLHCLAGQRVYHTAVKRSSRSVTQTAHVQQRSGTLCAQTKASPTSLHVWPAASAPVDTARTQYGHTHAHTCIVRSNSC